MPPKAKPMDVGVAPEADRQHWAAEVEPGSDPTASDFAPSLPDSDLPVRCSESVHRQVPPVGFRHNQAVMLFKMTKKGCDTLRH
jgi:hypothetical protein